MRVNNNVSFCSRPRLGDGLNMTNYSKEGLKRIFQDAIPDEFVKRNPGTITMDKILKAREFMDNFLNQIDSVVDHIAMDGRNNYYSFQLHTVKSEGRFPMHYVKIAGSKNPDKCLSERALYEEIGPVETLGERIKDRLNYSNDNVF